MRTDGIHLAAVGVEDFLGVEGGYVQRDQTVSFEPPDLYHRSQDVSELYRTPGELKKMI